MPEKIGKRFVSRLTRRTLALILAGGRGDRLKDLTRWRAKPAVPFGGKFRIIDFPLSNCVNSGVRRIGVLTQYKAHSLIRHLQRGWGFLQHELNASIPNGTRAPQTPFIRTSISCVRLIPATCSYLPGITFTRWTTVP